MPTLNVTNLNLPTWEIAINQPPEPFTAMSLTAEGLYVAINDHWDLIPWADVALLLEAAYRPVPDRTAPGLFSYWLAVLSKHRPLDKMQTQLSKNKLEVAIVSSIVPSTLKKNDLTARRSGGAPYLSLHLSVVVRGLPTHLAGCSCSCPEPGKPNICQ